MAKIRPKVNPKFRDFLPQRTEEERTLLRQSIIEDGVRDPLALDTTGNILDGYGRWEIAEELKLPVKTIVIQHLETDEQKFAWMARNQFGKRNLTKEQRDYYMGIRGAAALQSHGGDRGVSATGTNSGCPPETVESIAEEHGVDESTVRKNIDYAKAVNTAPPKVKDAILSGKSGLKKKAITEGPAFCQKCSRVGPVKNCPQCDSLRAKKNQKERKAKTKLKSGSMKFNWSKFDADFGVLHRAAARIADGYGLDKHTGDSEKARVLLATYHTHMMTWKKSLTKGEGHDS